jgi:hypothetical protein
VKNFPFSRPGRYSSASDCKNFPFSPPRSVSRHPPSVFNPCNSEDSHQASLSSPWNPNHPRNSFSRHRQNNQKHNSGESSQVITSRGRGRRATKLVDIRARRPPPSVRYWHLLLFLLLYQMRYPHQQYSQYKKCSKQFLQTRYHQQFKRNLPTPPYHQH